MADKIFVVRRRAVTSGYIPPTLKSCIDCYTPVKRTPKGWRLAMQHIPEGAMFLDDKYLFFSTYKSALEFIASEANRVAGELEGTKLKATRLLCDAHDELRRTKP
ncbi:hypothetical protein [Yokenella regensburgei]|uniref:hypothetical protein n=1 Tax=Yokenella regensburgei TaxID=158877 RepID=UPI001432896E|nr:hypothetical protein [Yokenella regensburgei]QIU92109.1 hypothetical protein HEC60_23645 [Yokenella regensburgei]